MSPFCFLRFEIWGLRFEIWVLRFEKLRGENGQCGGEQRKAGTLLLHVSQGLGRFGRNPAMSPFCFLRFEIWVLRFEKLLLHVSQGLRRFGRNPAMSPFCFGKWAQLSHLYSLAASFRHSSKERVLRISWSLAVRWDSSVISHWYVGGMRPAKMYVRTMCVGGVGS